MRKRLDIFFFKGTEQMWPLAGAEDWVPRLGIGLRPSSGAGKTGEVKDLNVARVVDAEGAAEINPHRVMA
ncbi:MAG: hypothetical protein OEV60_12755 [Actinomycetota bacterium]|nr:hypothetical protein [Actinomycetota bacterium]MDH5314358.1 hypothetical protein [Actinomycetota bacterium]